MTSPHISPVSATAFQVLPWLRYVSARDPQRVKNTSAAADLTCLATKGPCHEKTALSFIGNKGLATKRMKHPGRSSIPNVTFVVLDIMYPWLAMFRTVNEMDQVLDQGLRHAR